MSDFGAELRCRREAAGMSLAAFAAAVHFTKGYLSKIENGRVRANQRLAEVCDLVLGADGALRALVPTQPEQRPDDLQLAGLPERTAHFVGRGAELARLLALVRPSPHASVCVIHGMAGVGKTALALAAATAAERDFPGGSLFLDLHGHSPELPALTATDALDRLLRLLGVPGARIPADENGRGNLFRSRLRGRRVLLVYDNAHSARQVRALLPADHGCRVLITSRRRLVALDDAAHLRVDVLTESEALELLRSVSGRSDVDPGVAREIVALCGRLPLALRIAGARLRHGAAEPAEFARRLADELTRLDLLDDGERSVHGAFWLSIVDLAEPERRLFAVLSVHPGPEIEPDAVAALAGLDSIGAERGTDRLADAHLIDRDPGGHVRLHDLVRAFARAHLLPGLGEPERRAATTRLVEFAVGRAAAADRMVEPHRYRPEFSVAVREFPDEPAAAAWLRAQWSTLAELVRLAAEQDLPERCWQLAFLLRGFFFREKLIDPWIDTHRIALAAARRVNAGATAMTLGNLGMALVERGEACQTEALELFLAAGNDFGATDARANLAWTWLYRGAADRALRGLTEAVAAYRNAGRTRNEMITLRGMALAAAALGTLDDAATHAAQAETLADAPLDTVMALNCIAWVHYRRGEHPAAERTYTEAADRAADADLRFELARARTGLGNIAHATGDPDTTTDLWSSADALPVTLNPLLVPETRARLLLIEHDPDPG